MAIGRKTGGRKKGAPNKATAAKAVAIAASGLAPLDYLLSLLRNESLDHNIRLDAAKAAAPYVHAKLAPIEAKPPAEAVPSLAERIAELDRIDAIEASEGKVVERKH
jgi:hypothetical protein